MVPIVVVEDPLKLPGRADAVVVGLAEGSPAGLLSEAAQRWLTDWGVDPAKRLERLKATGKSGEIVKIQIDVDTPQAVVAVGLGDLGTVAARAAGAAVGRNVEGHRKVHVEATHSLDAQSLRAFIEGFHLAQFSLTFKTGKQPKPLAKVSLASALPDAPEAVRLATATAEAVLLARRLINTPSLVKTPAWMVAEVSKAMPTTVTTRVWGARDLKKDGFGGIIAVGSGSSRGPRMLQLSYEPAGATRHIVLAGKGITFDSGGISIKPPEFMVPMKTDMSGAAAVAGVMSAVAELGVGVRVTALLALAENMPSGSAMRPGDVVTHYGGRTSEILNTDAEGRIVLADLLAYAVANLAPDVIVDIATLTGAATLGLGRGHGALYATQDDLARDIVAAGAASGERLWRMPLVEEYDFVLDGSLADSRHVPIAKKIGAGSITAALYLRRFTDNVPWVHLDIAGPARSDAARGDINKGGTGFGTRALLRWLETIS